MLREEILLNAPLILKDLTFCKSSLLKYTFELYLLEKLSILSNGDLNTKIDIEADYTSKIAKEKIEKAGGKITIKNQSR
mgnify:CR=1 FL=1